MAEEVILIVDDIEENIALIKGFLEEEDYELLTARNGEDAIEIIKQRDPDLVLLDVLMPGMDGFEVCKKVKFEMDKKELPIIMVTALNARDDKIKGLEAGADDFLTKPIDWTELQARVKSALRLKSSYNRIEEQYRRLEYQLQVARSVQEGIAWINLPPEVEGEVFYRPIEEIGGDIYDLEKLDQNKYGILMADSSGHGVPAALVMVMIKLLFHEIDKRREPHLVLADLNRRMVDLFGAENHSLFVTAVYLVVDREEKSLSWSSAGHPFPLLIEGDNWNLLQQEGLPLGIMERADYNTEQVEFPQGSEIFLYTDGLIDVFCPGDSSLPEEKIEGIVNDLHLRDGDESAFYSRLQQKVEEGDYNDDICYTLFRFK